MTDTAHSFLSPGDQTLGERFLAEGYVAIDAEDRDALERIRRHVSGLAASHIGGEPPEDAGAFLNSVHDRVDAGEINAIRLAAIEGMNAEPWLRPAYFALARSALSAIVGNELAMQRHINISIQLPGDDSSLLPVHADVWSGDSPFEVVLWVPMVDCHDTKSMFLLPPGPNREFQPKMAEFRGKSAEDIYRVIEPDLLWLDVPYGKVVVFSQTLMHGNRVNEEKETRWSMNCRFKSVFSPYADKKLGEFFEPITLRAASRIGIDYDLPGGFDD